MAIRPRTRKGKGRRAARPGIQNPPPLNPPPTRRGNPGARQPPLNPPPSRRGRGGPVGAVAPGNDGLTNADEQKLQKLRNYKTQCENLAKLYEQKHNNEIIPLVNYIKQIREQTPDKRIGDLNIPKFIASLKSITVPDFNDTDLQRKVLEQKDMMRKSKNDVRKIRKKIEDFGVTVPSGVLEPKADVFVPGPAPVGQPNVFVPIPAQQPGPVVQPVTQNQGRAARLLNTAKRLGRKATQRLTRKKKPSPRLPGVAGKNKNFKKITKRKKKNIKNIDDENQETSFKTGTTLHHYKQTSNRGEV